MDAGSGGELCAAQSDFALTGMRVATIGGALEALGSSVSLAEDAQPSTGCFRSQSERECTSAEGHGCLRQHE